jgi:glycosyltransferase involved in cell wall biosynthesis
MTTETTGAVDKDRLSVLLVSPLPPPVGGIATWTEIFRDRGLSEPYELEIINSRVARANWFAPARPSPAELKQALTVVRQVRRSLRSGRHSLIHLSSSISSRGVFRDWAIARAAVSTKTPLVIELHGLFRVPEGRWLDVLARRAYTSLFDHSDAILVLNRDSATAVASMGPFKNKTQIVTGLVDTTGYPERVVSPAPDGNLKIIFVGAHTTDKGVFRLMEIVAGSENVEVQLFGSVDSPARERIEGMIRDAGMTDRVVINGPVDHDSVLRALAESDVLVFPTTHPEGFPLAIAEAMATGLAVITSPVGAVAEMIEDGRGGYVIPADDFSEFVRAIHRLQEQPDLLRQMGDFNRNKARSRYDHPFVARDLTAVYQRILNERK